MNLRHEPITGREVLQFMRHLRRSRVYSPLDDDMYKLARRILREWRVMGHYADHAIDTINLTHVVARVLDPDNWSRLALRRKVKGLTAVFNAMYRDPIGDLHGMFVSRRQHDTDPAPAPDMDQEGDPTEDHDSTIHEEWTSDHDV